MGKLLTISSNNLFMIDWTSSYVYHNYYRLSTLSKFV